MTKADRLFHRFPPFLREFIYSRGWESLREIQLAAADTILESDNNLLLSSSTASGKTEAALFPILTELLENPPEGGVSVLYIAPLKSLLNDQFARLDEVLLDSGIPVFHWHGDVSAGEKKKLLSNPSGILQITPESLESMLLRRSNDISRIFGGLRYVILDEIHTLIGNDRGGQIQCLLARLARKIGRSPRRIGLSATIGDREAAARWLGDGTGRKTDAPVPPAEKLRWRLGYAHFYTDEVTGENTKTRARELASNTPLPRGTKPPKDVGTAKDGGVSPMEDAENASSGEAEEKLPFDAGYSFLYDAVYKTKALVFSNSREETEYVTATLRQIAKKRGDPDVFYIHHGNLSASLREDAELVMKNEDKPYAVTCATVTMELGIDIGKLSRVVGVGAPYSVSSFLQRMGRSGRRGDPPEMLMLFREEAPLPNTALPALLPWELLRGIAVTELYLRHRFIEPPRKKLCPFSLAFHQTLSVLASEGEKSARALAEAVLSLPPLREIEKEDYRHLLLSMLQNDFIEMTEEKGLIVGLSGERLLNSFKFYAVFKDSEDYTVRAGSDEIGTITSPPPVGDRFALAGRVWEVTELDLPHKLLYVKRVDGKMEISWPGDVGEIHTRILEQMRDILFGNESYPYLTENAKLRLEEARRVAQNTGMPASAIIPTGGQSYVLFPWLGTRAFRAARRFLRQNAASLKIADVQSNGSLYLTFKAEAEDMKRFRSRLRELLASEIDPEALVADGEMPLYDKYDEYIPPALLRRAMARDRLDAVEMRKRLLIV